jgi:hypothetical protein
MRSGLFSLEGWTLLLHVGLGRVILNFFIQKKMFLMRDVSLCTVILHFLSRIPDPWRKCFEHFNKLLSFFQDGKLSAQFEQTMLVTETGVDVLTARPGKPFTPYFMDS